MCLELSEYVVHVRRVWLWPSIGTAYFAMVDVILQLFKKKPIGYRYIDFSLESRDHKNKEIDRTVIYYVKHEAEFLLDVSLVHQFVIWSLILYVLKACRK